MQVKRSVLFAKSCAVLSTRVGKIPPPGRRFFVFFPGVKGMGTVPSLQVFGRSCPFFPFFLQVRKPPSHRVRGNPRRFSFSYRRKGGTSADSFLGVSEGVFFLFLAAPERRVFFSGKRGEFFGLRGRSACNGGERGFFVSVLPFLVVFSPLFFFFSSVFEPLFLFFSPSFFFFS